MIGDQHSASPTFFPSVSPEGATSQLILHVISNYYVPGHRLRMQTMQAVCVLHSWSLGGVCSSVIGVQLQGYARVSGWKRSWALEVEVFHPSHLGGWLPVCLRVQPR